MNRIPLHAAVYVLCAVLCGCASLSVPAPKTFNQKVLAAYSSVDAVVQSTTTVARAGKISKQDAQNVHDQATNLKEGIQVAEQIHATDPSGGEDKLSVTITGLTALQAYLQAKQK